MYAYAYAYANAYALASAYASASANASTQFRLPISGGEPGNHQKRESMTYTISVLKHRC